MSWKLALIDKARIIGTLLVTFITLFKSTVPEYIYLLPDFILIEKVGPYYAANIHYFRYYAEREQRKHLEELFSISHGSSDYCSVFH